MAAKHHPDLIMCRKQPGIGIGRVCEKCDGRCVVCDSFVRPCTLVRVCDECNYGSAQGRCIVCGGPGIADAYYCKECTILEKDVCLPPPNTHAHARVSCFCPFHKCVSCCAARGMPADCEPRTEPNRPLLRAQKVRLPETLTRAVPLCCSFLSLPDEKAKRQKNQEK